MKPRIQSSQKAEYCEAKHNIGRAEKVFSLNLLM